MPISIRTLDQEPPNPDHYRVIGMVLGKHLDEIAMQAAEALVDLPISLIVPGDFGGSTPGAMREQEKAVRALHLAQVVYCDLYALECTGQPTAPTLILVGLALALGKSVAMRVGVYHTGVINLVEALRPGDQHQRPYKTWLSYKDGGALRALRYMVQDALGVPHTPLPERARAMLRDPDPPDWA